MARTPVLLITIDTLRADHLACYGYRRVETPAIDALAAQGVRFASAFTQVPITYPSHTVILTGTYPIWNGARDFTSPPLSPHVGLLSEAFKRNGYRTAAFVSAFVLDRSWGLDRGFETYDDHFSPEQYETLEPARIQRRAEVTVNNLLAWLREGNFGASEAAPFFVWLHLYDPHSPYDPPQPFHRLYAGHLYDGEIAYADSQLARLFGYLRRKGLYDRSLIVFLSDHGEGLGEHGEQEHSFFVYDSTLHIPLIIKPPLGEARPHVVSAPVGEIDVAPTILDLLHLRDPLSRQFQGASLAAAVLGKGKSPTQPVYAETYYTVDSFGWSPLHSITTTRYHYIDAPHPELYAWRTDPDEQHNLYAQNKALSAALRAELVQIEQRFTPRKPLSASSGPPLSPETVEKLKSLGYLAYSAPAPPADSETLPDPKDKLKVYNAILHAEDLSAVGRLEEANKVLQTLAHEEPHLYVISFMQAENAMRAHQWTEAQQEFLASLKLNPGFLQSIRGLARAYHAGGQDDKAKPLLQLILHQNPDDYLAHYGLGLMASEARQYPQAIQYFQAALREKPDYTPASLGLGIALVESRSYQKAITYLQRAAGWDQEEVVRLNFLGIATANTGDTHEAIELFHRALAEKPDYGAARLNLAFLYLKVGDHRQAIEEFQQLCRQDSGLCQQYRSMFQ